MISVFATANAGASMICLDLMDSLTKKWMATSTDNSPTKETTKFLVGLAVVKKLSDLGDTEIKKRFVRILADEIKIENMGINEVGEVNRSNLTRKTTMVLNKLARNSPLYDLTVVHEMEHAARSITVKGRLERFWNYSFVKYEESLAFGAEYDVLKQLLEKTNYEAAKKDLDGNFISNHKAVWLEKKWINEDGELTAAAGSLLMIFAMKQDLIEGVLKRDPEVENLLTWSFNQAFLEKLRLASDSDKATYIQKNLTQYGQATIIHRAILSIIHANGLIALGVALGLLI